MADRALFLSWGPIARGREQRALEVFNEAVTYYGELQRDGRIERFDVVLLTPNPHIEGFACLYGSHPQIDALREDDRFQRLQVTAELIVDHLNMLEGTTSEGIPHQVELLQQAIGQLPQPMAA
jgi:hypothetical protein